MKKLFFLLTLTMPSVLASCSNDNTDIYGGGTKGAILLESQMDGVITVETRTPALKDLMVVLSGPNGTSTMTWPSGDVIDNLPVGDYRVKLTNKIAGMPSSGFGNDFWEGISETVRVDEGQTATATVVCSQKNSGVFFEYGSELLSKSVVPSVTGTDDLQITYISLDGTTAYFAPGELTIRLSIDGIPAKLDGEYTKTITTTAGKDYKLSLSSSGAAPGVGSITIGGSVEDPETVTINIEIEEEGTGPAEPQPIAWEDVPASGTYVMTVTSQLYDILTEPSFSGTFTRNDSNKSLVLTGWPMRNVTFAMTLVYDETEQMFYAFQGVASSMGTYFTYEAWLKTADLSTIPTNNVTGWVPIDLEKGIMDFTYMNDNGEPVYWGCWSTGMMNTGVCGEFIRGTAEFEID